MKGTKGFGARGHGTGPLDLGTVFDEIFEAAKDLHDEFRKNFGSENFHGEHFHENLHENLHGEKFHRKPCEGWFFNENTDYYPNYSYPPMNVYMTGDRSLIFEFALAGFDEKDISLSFQGDYMVFSAALPRDAGQDSSGTSVSSENAAGRAYEGSPDENIRYLKHRLKMKAIERQKYFVPLDKYAQEKVKAVFRNGILKVSIPPKEEPDQNDGIRIEIVTDS